MVLYEFGWKLHGGDIIKIAILIMMPIYINLFTGSFENKLIHFIGKIVAILVGSFLFYIFLIMPVQEYLKIQQNIKAGNILVVEGEVRDFDTPNNSWGGHESESFMINGVQFEYTSKENYGYCTFRCDGGVIVGDGQKLRVWYCVDELAAYGYVICFIQSLNE